MASETSAETGTSRRRHVRHEVRPRTLTVTRVETITPRYVRVTFGGDDLADLVTLDADDHLRLALPLPGQSSPTRPEWTEKGPVWPEGQRPTIRDYTPRRFDAAARSLEVDFVVHGGGPASTWAAQAAPGQQVGSFGPRGSTIVDDVFAWYLLIGDETALPAIARRLEEMTPGTRAVAVIEVDGAGDEQPIDTVAEARIVWAHRDGSAAGTTDVLAAALRGIDRPAGDVFVWAGGEATTLRGIRRMVLGEWGVPLDAISFSGHWRRGTTDFDHHEPIE